MTVELSINLSPLELLEFDTISQLGELTVAPPLVVISVPDEPSAITQASCSPYVVETLRA